MHGSLSRQHEVVKLQDQEVSSTCSHLLKNHTSVHSA